MDEKQIIKNFSGLLRVRTKILATDKIQLEWFDPETKVVIWTETCQFKNPDYSFVSQVITNGNFETSNGYFMDDEGKRHFVMKCDVGRLGAMFNTEAKANV